MHNEGVRAAQALLEVRIRPNLCSLHNGDVQLPMHIVAACRHPAGAEAVELLAEAYIPACWTQAREGEGEGEGERGTEGGRERARERERERERASESV